MVGHVTRLKGTKEAAEDYKRSREVLRCTIVLGASVPLRFAMGTIGKERHNHVL